MARRRVARLGAATFALGLSLAAPQSLGVASADAGETDSSAVAAHEGDSRGAAAKPAGREAGRGGAVQRGTRVSAAPAPAAAEPRRGAAAAQRAAASVAAPALPAGSVPDDRDELPAAVLDTNTGSEDTGSDDTSSDGNGSETADIPTRQVDDPMPWWRGAGGDVAEAPDTVDDGAVEVDDPIAVPLYNSGQGVAARPDLNQSLAGLNASVAGLFDAVSRLLSSLPANPISEFLSGALLLVRRAVFNSEPTATPVQYATDVDGQFVGTVGAVDPEGGPLRYTVTAAPQFGSVTVDADGNFVYTPGDEFTGTDTFQVGVADEGFNILDPLNGATAVDVLVASRVGRTTKGFDVYNWTSRTIRYTGNHGTYLINPWVWQAPDTGPTLGWELKPGETAHFEVVFNAFQDTYTAPEFQATDGSYNTWSAALALDAFYTREATCSDYKSTCSTSEDGTKVYFLDAPGTVIDVPAGQGQRQADMLKLLCNDKNSSMTCAFTPAADGFKQTLTDYKFATPPLRNTSSSDATLTLSRSETVETTSSVSLTGGVKASILKIVEIGVERNTTQSFTSSTQWSYSIGVQAKPGEWAVLLTKDPIKRVTGDFRGTIGNTTWILRDVSFDTPDPDPSRPPLPESGLPPGVSDQGKPVYTAYASPLNPTQPAPPV